MICLNYQFSLPFISLSCMDHVNPGKAIIGAGIVVIILGVVFYLQGQSVVGPESSFMYSNPEWITNGQWIALIGVVIFVEGIVVLRANSQLPK